MKKYQKLSSYIFRSWKDEPSYTHPRLKTIPPFLLELIAYLIGLVIFCKVGYYIFFFF